MTIHHDHVEEAVPALPPLTAGDVLRRALAVLLPISVVVTALALFADVEYLMGGFPVSGLMALVLAFAVTPIGRWSAFLPPMAVLLAICMCSLIIAAGNLRPATAQTPISILWLVFGLFWLPPAWFAAFQVWRWRRAAHQAPPTRWQFQIKYMLGLTAFLSVLLALLKRMEFSDLEFMFFAYGSAGLLLLMGLAGSLFWVRRTGCDKSPF